MKVMLILTEINNNCKFSTCEYFCFISEKNHEKCLCPDGMELENNSHLCKCMKNKTCSGKIFCKSMSK